MSVLRLETDQLDELVDRVARRVVELLAEPERVKPLVDAATVARALGVSRAWVYEHKGALGGERLSDGPRSRLRFDMDAARAGKDRVDEGRTLRRAPAHASPLLPVKRGAIRAVRSDAA